MPQQDIKSGLNARHRFRDPLYGFIELTDAELRIVDTPLFQRLRRIHQLALTKYVYPTAEHSRFVHSLGAIHTATSIFECIIDNSSSDLPYVDKLNFAKYLRFAALLHDIGHLPFSHAAEKLWIAPSNHERLGAHIIEHYSPITQILEDEDINPKVLSSILTNEYRPKHKILHEVISGYLDADRADYLLRDSYCCGVKYGEYDFNRYIRIFSAQGMGSELQLAIQEKDICIAEAFLLARYHYNIQVPYHRTRTGYDIILENYLSSSTDFSNWFKIEPGSNTFKEVNFDEFQYLDDYSMFENFKRDAKSGNPWASMLLRQGHLSTIFDSTTSIMNGLSNETFKSYCQVLKSSSDLKENEDFFIKKTKVELIKVPDTIERNPDGTFTQPIQTVTVHCQGTLPNSQNNLDITAYSWIFNRLAIAPPTLLRIFVAPDKKQQAHNALVAAGLLREKGK